MRLSDFLSDVGRPVAYYPALRRVTGSTTATILLCQFIYWIGKTPDKQDGWIWKSSSQIEEETGLSYEEQKTARAKLRQAGLLEERNARLEHAIYFRPNLDRLNELWEQQPPKEEAGTPFANEPMPRSGTSQCHVRERANATSESYTETTPETTTERKREHVTEPSTSASDMGGADAPPPPAPPKRVPKAPKPKTPIPEAVEVFRSEANRFPPKSWFSSIADAVGSDPPDLDRWRAVVHAWVGSGYNPTNVQGMLECYKRKEMPGTTVKARGNGSNGQSILDRNLETLQRWAEKAQQGDI